MLQIEHILINNFIYDTYASIPSRGIHKGLKRLDKSLKSENIKYCLKFDIKKYFPNINHRILKQLIRKKIKDKDLLWLLDEIIDSIDGNKGIPIGNYLSQYFANFYLSYFDHWMKEEKKCKYYFRYMDDIVILHNNKKYLRKLKNEIEQYLDENLDLKLKENWQVFPIDIRGIDFLGYRHFGNFILLRKSTTKEMKIKMKFLLNKCEQGINLTYSEWCSINSYKGWLKWCNSYNLYNKYIKPLEKYERQYYRKYIKK